MKKVDDKQINKDSDKVVRTNMKVYDKFRQL